MKVYQVSATKTKGHTIPTRVFYSSPGARSYVERICDRFVTGVAYYREDGAVLIERPHTAPSVELVLKITEYEVEDHA